MKRSILLPLIAVFLCVANLSKATSSANISGDQSEIINIVYVADRKYLPYTYTSLISVLENSKYIERAEPIRFTIILDEMEFKGILDDGMSKFLNAFFLAFNRNIYKYNIEYIPIPDIERERISKFNSYWWPKSIFLKLSFSNFLPYKKCLYLDGDTICVSDIRELWIIDLEKYCFGACDHNIRHGALFYNAGVILMNLEKMREVGFASEVEKLVITGQETENGISYSPTSYSPASYSPTSYFPASYPPTSYSPTLYFPASYPMAFYVEETALVEYSQKHTDTGAINLDFRYNVCVSALPTEGSIYNNFADINLEGLEEWQVNLYNSGFLNKLGIIHYYFGEKATKPWNCIPQYEAAGCPSFEDTKNNFWKTTWKHNPWAFWIWHEYYKKYYEIENSIQS